MIEDDISSVASSGEVFNARRNRIGVDYGPRFIGVAYADFFGNVNTHSMISNNGNLTKISEELFTIARSFGATEIVLGVPVGRTGVLDYNVRNFNGQLCLNFSRVLASVVQHETQDRMKVILYDERYTTQEAKLKLSSTKKKGKKVKLHLLHV